MKNLFQRLHRTVLIAFPLLSVLLQVYQMLFGQLPALMLVLWVAALSLLIMVLLACITLNVARSYRAGELPRLLRRYLIAAPLCAALLAGLDLLVGEVAWGPDLLGGLVFGLLALYRKP